MIEQVETNARIFAHVSVRCAYSKHFRAGRTITQYCHGVIRLREDWSVIVVIRHVNREHCSFCLVLLRVFS